ncbi:hypothetical protein [uncultured Clostridium sp.]|uniref:hypothetical protein n=1 Tax=uncultured Clostridium sp. TaxID=59620 RepID=UPI00263A81A8|nr:hypothetical protein [uncultured Clostridium sp.]
MKETITLDFDNELLKKLIENRSNNKVAEYYTLKEAEQTLAQIINNLEGIDHKKVQENMYPQLWKEMRDEVLHFMDTISIAFEMEVSKSIKEIIDNEDVDPILKPEDRPIQSEEDKEKGLTFIDPIPIPQEVLEQQQMRMPDINIMEQFSNKSFEDILDEVLPIINKKFPDIKEDVIEFKEDLLKCEVFNKSIENKTVEVNDLDTIATEVLDYTGNVDFANIIIWEIFEMPDIIRQQIDQYYNAINSIKENTIINSDDEYIFINPDFKRDGEDEDYSKEDTRKFILNYIDDAFKNVSLTMENISIDEENQEQFINNTLEDMNTFLINNDEFINGIINQKIKIVEFDNILTELCNIILANFTDLGNEVTDEFIEDNEDIIKASAFNAINLYFPPTIPKTDTDENESEGVEVKENEEK